MMNALTQQTREREVNSPFSSLFFRKAGYLFYAAGIFFYGAGVVYRFVWMRIFRGLYDLPYSGDQLVSATEIAAEKLSMKIAIYGATHLLWSLGIGAVCAGLLGYCMGYINDRVGHVTTGLPDAESARSGICVCKKGKGETETAAERGHLRAFTNKTSVISFLLSIALFVSALLHQLLWDRVFDQFVGSAVKLPVELVMQGGTLLLLSLSAGALIIVFCGVTSRLVSASRNVLRVRRERAHD